MLVFFLTILILCVGLTLAVNKSPVTLGFWVLLLSILTSLLIGCIFLSWFGFIVFLIYIGGILVIFSYFVAIQPNQNINMKKVFFWSSMRFLNLPINIYPVLIDLFYRGSWWLSSLFSFSNISVLLALGLVLFLALVSVVKIRLINIAPLRPYLRKYV